MRYLRWFIACVLILLTTAILSIHIFEGVARCSPERTASIFNSADISYQSKFVDFDNRQIRVVSTGNQTGKLICFVHGAPGAWSAFDDYLKDTSLRAETQMIAIDRLGYGYSDYGKAEIDIIKHAKGVIAVLENYTYDTLILVGHSYGGPIVGYLAAQQIEHLAGTIMLAPVIDPEGEKMFWFNKLLSTKIIKSILPALINVANEEKNSHANALKHIEDQWQNIQTPILHMHCHDDKIAPYAPNVCFSQRMIPASCLIVESWEGAGHFIPFNSYQTVKDKIYSFL